MPVATPAAGSLGPPRARSPRTAGSARRARPVAAKSLVLDPATVAAVEGVEQEVALLRAAIRRLAVGEDAAGQVKTLAELRHQIDTLCTALKTQRALAGRDADALSASLAQVLEELGDELGVPG